MIDLHSHTLFSDGVLLPSELIYRAKAKGYSAIALTDHGDISTIDFIIPRIVKVSRVTGKYYGIKVIPGIELTYVPVKLIKSVVKKARRLGAKIVVIHGQSPVEPVPPGTNKAGILSGADIIAHPGYISADDVKLAKARNVLLEITSRNGHNKTNRHVAKLAKKYNASLVLNTDTHTPEDLLTEEKIKKILKMSGLKKSDFEIMQNTANKLISKIL
ncbi:MAG: histidinol phosphate phosphatase domain-containing protein [Elusimicrobia bacterium]|nr:histidinol phosphate phosphatase domain-containing protein [Candidatus Liberimonas magnetica]